MQQFILFPLGGWGPHMHSPTTQCEILSKGTLEAILSCCMKDLFAQATAKSYNKMFWCES